MTITPRAMRARTINVLSRLARSGHYTELWISHNDVEALQLLDARLDLDEYWELHSLIGIVTLVTTGPGRETDRVGEEDGTVFTDLTISDNAATQTHSALRSIDTGPTSPSNLDAEGHQYDYDGNRID